MPVILKFSEVNINSFCEQGRKESFLILIWGQKVSPFMRGKREQGHMERKSRHTGDRAQVGYLESWPPAPVWLDTGARRPHLPGREAGLCAVSPALDEILPSVTQV